ncbi:MAG TPA: LPXTG cell wall anchor domain-containing protein [Jatrophihabitantaceae bacterium]
MGSAALVAGATLSALGLTTAPAAHADAQGVAYSCSLALGGASEPFDTTADFTGTAPASAQEGDAVTLDQLSVTVHIPLLASLQTLGAQGIDGTLSPIEVDAAVGDADSQAGRTGASIVHVDGPVVGPFDITASPGQVSFDANKPGLMTFGAGTDLDGTLQVTTLTGGEEDLVLQCSRSGAAATIASTNVTAKPSSPPPSHPSSPPSSSTPPPTHGASAPASLGNASPTPSTSSSTSAEVGTSNTNRTTAQHPQLANTGFSQAEDLTIGGGLLVLLGGGLMFAARRRSTTDLDT